MYMVAPQDDLVDELFENLRDKDRETIERTIGYDEARKIVKKLLKQCVGQIFMTDDGRVAAMFIAMQKWKGVAEILAYTTPRIEENMVGFHKACLRGIDHLEDQLELHKLQALVWVDYDRSKRWLKRLGFEQEGHLKAHGPDKSDAILMGRVF